MFKNKSIKLNSFIHRLCPFHRVGSREQNWIYRYCTFRGEYYNIIIILGVVLIKSQNKKAIFAVENL